MKNVEQPHEEIIPDHLLQKGTQIFGSQQLFMAWLNRLNEALGDVKPVELIHERQGLRLIESALDAIVYGNVM